MDLLSRGAKILNLLGINGKNSCKNHHEMNRVRDVAVVKGTEISNEALQPSIILDDPLVAHNSNSQSIDTDLLDLKDFASPNGTQILNKAVHSSSIILDNTSSVPGDNPQTLQSDIDIEDIAILSETNILTEALQHSIVLDDTLLRTSSTPHNVQTELNVKDGLTLNGTEIITQGLHPKIIIFNDTLLVPGSNTQNFETEPEGKGNKKTSQQKHCCLYCHKMVFKIYRHYISVHKDENDVKEIIALPEKTSLRRVLLDKLRKKGDYIYNTQLKAENERPLVCRQTSNKCKAVRVNDVPCPSCKGFYSKYSIRHHLEKCIPVSEKSKRRGGIQVECRRLQNNIHHIASDALRRNVFPVLNDDAVTNAIRYDEAIIIYANYLCRKYTTPHHAAQIRSNMRALGRLILAIGKLNPSIHCWYDVLDVRYVDLIVKGIDKVAGLDENTNLYNAPATAMLLSTELKKLCKLLLMEFIKKNDKESKKRMEDLYSILNSEFHVTINKKGIETQKINSRRKKNVLPKTDQIAEFRVYLENKIKYFISKLEKTFCKEYWIHLAEYTLVHLTVFNRKRPGETQRILIDDYKNYEVIDDEITDDLLSKEQIKKWARIRFTGKLGNNTALLVHRKFGFKALDLILQYREQAGVNTTNRYVFGLPSKFHKQSTFQACQLIRKFAQESGVVNPHLLRTRFLRQHLATETATSNVDNRLEGRVSDFMSHKRKIHEDYYVITQKHDDIMKVSKLLENFSSPMEQKESCTSVGHCSDINNEIPDGAETSSDESEKCLSNAEVNYALGKKRSRHSWSSAEKIAVKKSFHDEIYRGEPLENIKVKQFYEDHKDLYIHRTPHLIAQWIRGAQDKMSYDENKKKAKRLRWSTPEKEVLRSSTERHSSEGTNPSIAECELLLNQNSDILSNRNAHSIKSYIYSELKRKTSSI